MNLRNWSTLILYIGGICTALHGQQQTQKTDNTKVLETEEIELAMLKFEPNYTENSAQKRQLFLRKRMQVDSMQISDRKKQKLIKALYKDLNSTAFEKALLADQYFEDDID